MASITHRLAALHLRRNTDADFTLICQGTEVKAHSFVLATWSDYFELAQSGNWVENTSKKIEFKDCTADVLHAAVNFIYGISIPDNFKEGPGLLCLADLLMMEGLKQEAAKLLAKNLTTENYLEASQAAELYSVENLINSCAEFVFEKVKDVDWEEMEKLPKVMSAFVKIAKKEKEKREGAEESCEGLLNEARLFSEMLERKGLREARCIQWTVRILRELRERRSLRRTERLRRALLNNNIG